MSSAVAELEASLQAMLSLKPPGVSGSKIQSLTALCTANVQSESVLIQKLYTHFKKAPGTHKLGVLYVVDSVTRKWTEQAKSIGQTIGNQAEDGTYAAGVNRVKDLLPSFMNDIIQSAPDDQKEKIRKLVDIWEKGQTFPIQLLNSFKEKLNAAPPKSTTPDGTPPPNLQSSLGVQPNPQVAATPNTTSILEALAKIARQNTTAAAATPNVPAPDNSFNRPNTQSNPAPHISSMSAVPQFPIVQPPVNVPGPAGYTSQAQGSSSGAQNFPNNPPLPYTGVPPPISQGAMNPALEQQLAVLKTLAASGVPQEQWATVLAALAATGPQANSVGGVPPPQQLPAPNHNAWGARQEEPRDRSGYNEAVRSPPGRQRRHSRSLSPQRAWDARDSPSSRRRDDQSFGDYGRESPGRGREDRRGARGVDYRQRSPPARRGRSPSPPYNRGSAEKWVQFDHSIGKGNIKVLSRTLFVGGVTTSEHELRSMFDRFGKVQTCIVNKDKRHAFVKMISRQDAVNAKEAMESSRAPDSQLRTRWGVGFGPRDCSDYQTGVSIIPISKLTDADRKWMLTAEYGGSGGKPIESGMVVEEPDIEIGQGVSSKAISRRMQTDKGGNNGPKSSRDHDDDEGGRHRRDHDKRRDDDRGARGGQAANPPVMPPLAIPGFPYPMTTLPNGMQMPMFPPGFTFPGQLPAPGQRN